MDESKVDKSYKDWSIDALREYFERLLKEQDRRYEQRFNDQQRAIEKAEQAAETRFQGVNEFRQTLGDQAANFVTRNEVDKEFEGLHGKMDSGLSAVNNKVDAVTGRMDRLDGRSGGYTATWGYLVGAVVLIGGLLTIVAGIVGAAIFVASRGGP